MSSHNTVHPRSIHRVPASHCPQCKPFPLDSLVILDLASFHDLYTQVPTSRCPQCKPFPLDSPWVILDLKSEPQLPIVLNVSLSPWTLPWAEADVTSLVPMLSPTLSTQDPYTGLSESGPKVTSTMVQSRLFWCCPEPASKIKLEQPHQMAVPTNHNLGGHVIQLTSYLIDMI